MDANNAPSPSAANQTFSAECSFGATPTLNLGQDVENGN